MKILITGSNGFIGKNISGALVKKHKITGVDISPSGAALTIDITDFRDLEKFIQKNKDIDVIIHSAALAHNKGTDLSFDAFMKINFEGTKNLVDLSNRFLKLKRFIFFSTIAVYGEDPGKSVYKEEDPCSGRTPYARSKIMSEEYLQKNAQFKYTIMRLSPVYGKEFALNIDRRTRIGNFIYRVGRGTNRLSLLHVKNVVQFVEHLLLDKTAFINGVYNLADNQIYSFNDLIRAQVRKSGIDRRLYFPRFVFHCAYFFGRITGNNFLIENSVKLLTDRIYDTSKVSSGITFKYNLFDAF